MEFTFSNLISESDSEHSSMLTVATPNEALGKTFNVVGIGVGIGFIKFTLSSLSLECKKNIIKRKNQLHTVRQSALNLLAGFNFVVWFWAAQTPRFVFMVAGFVLNIIVTWLINSFIVMLFAPGNPKNSQSRAISAFGRLWWRHLKWTAADFNFWRLWRWHLKWTATTFDFLHWSRQLANTFNLHWFWHLKSTKIRKIWKSIRRRETIRIEFIKLWN